MSTNITVVAQRRDENGKWQEVPSDDLFDYCDYNVFGWMAGVRNYSAVTPLAEPRGLPPDWRVKEVTGTFRDGWDWDIFEDHGCCSWYTTDELMAVDYDQVVEDRRVMINNNGGCTCPSGEGVAMTLREFLGETVVNEFMSLRERGIERIVFGFS